jgi:hypothetical protein
MMTGVSLVASARFRLRRNSHPSSLGIITSRTMAIGWVFATICRASAPFIAPMTLHSDPDRYLLKRSMMPSLSSITSKVIGPPTGQPSLASQD